MSDHDESFMIIPGKGPITSRNTRQSELDENDEVADSRQDERLGNSLESIELQRDEDSMLEERVYLSPRVYGSSDINTYQRDDDLLSIRACASFTSDSVEIDSPAASSPFKDFLRHNPCPVIPSYGHEASPIKRDKPTLCRSMAWSQDSMEESRMAKRQKEDHYRSLHESYAVASGCHHSRQDSMSPTTVHWEEKIVDSMDFNTLLNRSTNLSHKRDGC